MKTHESSEDYLETILILTNKNPIVRSIDIANELNFSKPSVSVAMKKLREREYISMDSDGLISLTDKGKSIAESTYEKHVFLSEWLASIGVDPYTAAQDACRIEHVVSPESFAAIKTYVTNKKQP